MSLGDQIKALREARGMTREDLGARIGVSGAYLSMLESGKRTNPTREVLRKLADVLGVSVAQLEGEDDPYANPIPPVPTWRRMGVSEDRIAQAAAIWADLTRDQRDKLSGHLQASASSLAAVDALIQQVQVRLDALRAQVQVGNDPPAAADPIRPADTVEPEGSDNPTRHGNFSSILEM